MRGKERPSESFQTALKGGRYKKRGWLSATPKHTHIKRKEKSFNKRAGSYRGKLDD
ncbi:hypothetical protein NEIFL0001_1847 [Neisseria flavescens SK114]|nr:hypothetical protein NEIFL0001_1847 [Neisseria flavescens SK114]